MKIDAHMHFTIPVELTVDKLHSLGFDKGIICSSAVARGEGIFTISDANAMMARVANAQNKPADRTVSQINQEIMTAVGKYPDMLWGFGKVDLFQPNISETIAEIKALGMKGIGEIIGIHNNVKLLAPILDLAGNYSLPVFLHTDYPVDARDLADIFVLADQFPKAILILGHAGGDFWLDAIAGAENRHNVYLDTSEIVNQVALQVAVNTLPDRIMFSTDFPWDAPESMLARIDALDCQEAVKEQILGNTAASLFSVL